MQEWQGPLTTNEATYVPAASALKVGRADVAADNVAVLPAGRLVRVQAYVSASPFASELALPSSVTNDPVVTFWAVPAFATGATLATAAVTVTVVPVLLSRPSLTTSEAT